MKTKILLLVFAFAFVGCKGKQGDKGDTGMPGTGHFQYLSGAVFSDDFTVTNTEIIQSQQTTVYVYDGVNYTTLNLYLPGAGINSYCLVNPTLGQIRIVNARTAGAVAYLIALYLS